MIDKIKKLVESTNYDDNRLALVLIAENYDIKELWRNSSNIQVEGGIEYRHLPQFGTNRMSRPNGLVIGKWCIYHSRDGLVGIEREYHDILDDSFIEWKLKEKESE